ncbi:hypothetical protein AVL62_15010 [Serinicoccus chungangensis]|uniref:DUF3817 domain-containing protein n=1 Tax=Serinicoccus chungangensis TaxID=767452 RepID=A0A0W8IAX1_9MICO|nr:DUF3817 domain-containing protein [Serinicoccus chungangensis]KUG57101.1 hypothetical protein AVL62_15010 [Serinicoccus chungangensis]
MTPPGPGRLLRVLADAEAVTWSLLLIGMALKYLTRTTDLGVSIAGPIHGFVFLAYCVVVVVVAVDQRWGARTLVLGLFSAVPPFVTIPFEQSVRRRGLAPAEWRLREDGVARTLPERALHGVLRRPLVWAAVALVAVTVVFVVLLRLGPPVG